MLPPTETCHQAMLSRDRRFDGWFYVAVATTGIYCRPSCPAATPKPQNVRFYPTAAAAQAAGFRACLRCRPDASPGSPEWNLRADVAGRAMRLIADGVVDREGVEGLARRLAYSPRHLRRLLIDELGAGPLDLARAQRAHTARLLIETAALPFEDVAFAAGFSSVRQFNDTMRAIFALTPTEMRRRAARRRRSGDAPPAAHLGIISVRLPFRAPLDAAALLDFLGERAIPGVEEVAGGTYRRTLRLPHGEGVAELSPADGRIDALLHLADLRDLAAAVERCRALFDLDADPSAVDAALGGDDLLAPLVAASPGRRVPGTVDGAELAVRTVLGQQITVGAARGVAGRLSAALGRPLAAPHGRLITTFPEPEALADAPDDLLPLTASRRRAVRSLAAAIADGRLALDGGADRDELRERLVGLPGIGDWTASFILMRLGDSDAFPETDHGVVRALDLLGQATGRRGILARAEAWRPWRAYATQHLWGLLAAGGRRPQRGENAA